MTDDAPLTQRQAQLMAWLDDELEPAERASFEQAMATDAELATEAAKLRNMLDLSRSMKLAEPTDHEIRRFWARFYNRAEWRLGWILLLSGLVILAGEGVYLLLTSTTLGFATKGAILSAATGGLLLFWNTARLKLRTSRFDRYRGVMR